MPIIPWKKFTGNTSYPELCYWPEMEGTFVKYTLFFEWSMRAFLQTVASPCVKLNTFPQIILSPSSCLFLRNRTPSSIISCWEIRFLSPFQMFIITSCLSLCVLLGRFPSCRIGNTVFNKMFHVSGIPTDSTWYVILGKELFYPTHLVLPWNCEAPQYSIEVQFTIILVVSKFKDGTPKAIKWIRSNLKKN